MCCAPRVSKKHEDTTYLTGRTEMWQRDVWSLQAAVCQKNISPCSVRLRARACAEHISNTNTHTTNITLMALWRRRCGKLCNYIVDYFSARYNNRCLAKFDFQTSHVLQSLQSLCTTYDTLCDLFSSKNQALQGKNENMPWNLSSLTQHDSTSFAFKAKKKPALLSHSSTHCLKTKLKVVYINMPCSTSSRAFSSSSQLPQYSHGSLLLGSVPLGFTAGKYLGAGRPTLKALPWRSWRSWSTKGTTRKVFVGRARPDTLRTISHRVLLRDEATWLWRNRLLKPWFVASCLTFWFVISCCTSCQGNGIGTKCTSPWFVWRPMQTLKRLTRWVTFHYAVFHLAPEHLEDVACWFWGLPLCAQPHPVSIPGKKLCSLCPQIDDQTSWATIAFYLGLLHFMLLFECDWTYWTMLWASATNLRGAIRSSRDSLLRAGMRNLIPIYSNHQDGGDASKPVLKRLKP